MHDTEKVWPFWRTWSVALGRPPESCSRGVFPPTRNQQGLASESCACTSWLDLAADYINLKWTVCRSRRRLPRQPPWRTAAGHEQVDSKVDNTRLQADKQQQRYARRSPNIKLLFVRGLEWGGGDPPPYNCYFVDFVGTRKFIY